MKEIGGYFEWEDSYGQEYHPNLIPLNTGRNAPKIFRCTRRSLFENRFRDATISG